MPRTIIVVPCYNESKRLNREAFQAFAQENPDVKFLMVNDGSRDNTLECLSKMAEGHSNIEVLDVQPNGGKANAVRKGMLHAAGQDCDYIAFLDADLATPLWEIPNFVREMERKNYDMVTGLRLMRLGAGVKRKTKRHYMGRVFATVASIMLGLPVYDTQCGAKMYRRQIVEPLFRDTFITRWLFDVELMARYVTIYDRERAKEKIYEYPLLQWIDVTGSQLKARDFIKAPMEMLKIKRRYL